MTQKKFGEYMALFQMGTCFSTPLGRKYPLTPLGKEIGIVIFKFYHQLFNTAVSYPDH